MRYRPWCSVEVSTNDMCFCSSRAAGRRPADGRPSGGRPPYEQKTSNRFCNCATFWPKKLGMVSCVQVDTLRPILHKNMHINERLTIFTSLGPYFDMGLFGNWHDRISIGFYDLTHFRFLFDENPFSTAHSTCFEFFEIFLNWYILMKSILHLIRWTETILWQKTAKKWHISNENYYFSIFSFIFVILWS